MEKEVFDFPSVKISKPTLEFSRGTDELNFGKAKYGIMLKISLLE
jgi:hypothetical protein